MSLGPLPVAHGTKHRFRHTCFVLGVACCALLLAACRFPGTVKPTVKIGLSAPFEGRDRDLGYEVLYAVRLAVRQRNESGGIADRYLVELVALNDFNEAEEAVIQGRKMAVDSGVMGVLGGWSPAVAEAAAPEYERLGLAFLSPDGNPEAALPPPIQADLSGYEALSGGVAPGPAAVWAYGATKRLLDALDAAARSGGQPDRRSVWQALAASP